MYLLISIFSSSIIQFAFVNESSFALEFTAAIRGSYYGVIRFGGYLQVSKNNFKPS